MTTIKSFVERLKKIGIEVQLSANYPWIYMDKVNGKRIGERFQGNHGFTVFFKNKEERITDISKIFDKIRQIVINGKENYIKEEDYDS